MRLTDLSGIDHGKYNAIISRPSGHFHGCPDRGLFYGKNRVSEQSEGNISPHENRKRRKTHENGITGTGTAEQIRLLIENSIPKELDVQIISYDYDQLQNIRNCKRNLSKV